MNKKIIYDYKLEPPELREWQCSICGDMIDPGVDPDDYVCNNCFEHFYNNVFQCLHCKFCSKTLGFQCVINDLLASIRNIK